jgi:hypothetical protein
MPWLFNLLTTFLTLDRTSVATAVPSIIRPVNYYYYYYYFALLIINHLGPNYKIS